MLYSLYCMVEVLALFANIRPNLPHASTSPSVNKDILILATGIWLVGTIGRETGSIKPHLVACYVALPFFITGVVNYSVITFVGNILPFYARGSGGYAQNLKLLTNIF